MVETTETAAIRPDEGFDVGRLAAWLAGRLPHAEGPLTVEQFPGGHSNLTYLLRYPAAEYALRRPPLGPVAPRAHDMGREHRVLAALWQRFPPAPRPYVFCDDVSVIGAPFYVMERRRGLVVRLDEPATWSATPSMRRRATEAIVDVMADLHAVDWKAAGLTDLGRPEGFVARQVDGWAERWERARDTDVPAIDALARWLRDRVPEPTAATLVHGDIKLDNVMLDPADPGRVVALFDWEMCTTGDPLVDLGSLLGYWTEPGDPGERKLCLPQVTARPGWPSRRDIIARYAARTGRDVSRAAYYEVFALYKVAVVIQQIYIRWKRGQTKDARFAAFAAAVDALARVAADLADRSGL